MRQLLPESLDEVDPYDAVAPDDPRGPVLRVNFVVSVDGSITDRQQRSGGLGGEGDRALFLALRAWADAILVGAGTARAERYGPHRLRPSLAARRAADGRSQPAAIVLVTRSLDLDFNASVFTSAVTPTIVMTCASAPADRREAAKRAGRLIVAGDAEVDLAEGLRRLREDHGLSHVLCEGGPRLTQGLLDARLVDELFLTLAPTLVGNDGPHLVEHLREPVALRVTRLLAEGSEFYVRYQVTGS